MSIFKHDVPVIGILVHYVMRAEDYLPGASRQGYECRPAVIMDALEDPEKPMPVNLRVLRGADDGAPPPLEIPPSAPNAAAIQIPLPAPGTMWRPGVVYSEEHTPGTWHWAGH